MFKIKTKFDSGVSFHCGVWHKGMQIVKFCIHKATQKMYNTFKIQHMKRIVTQKQKNKNKGREYLQSYKTLMKVKYNFGSDHFSRFVPLNWQYYCCIHKQKESRGGIYSLFHTKYLQDNKDNVHVQSLSGVQQCLWQLHSDCLLCSRIGFSFLLVSPL